MAVKVTGIDRPGHGSKKPIVVSFSDGSEGSTFHAEIIEGLSIGDWVDPVISPVKKGAYTNYYLESWERAIASTADVAVAKTTETTADAKDAKITMLSCLSSAATLLQGSGATVDTWLKVASKGFAQAWNALAVATLIQEDPYATE